MSIFVPVLRLEHKDSDSLKPSFLVQKHLFKAKNSGFFSFSIFNDKHLLRSDPKLFRNSVIDNRYQRHISIGPCFYNVNT